MFEHFKYLTMEVCLIAKEDMNIPGYHGSMLRGVIGQTLRRVSCTCKGADCLECMFKTACPYTNVFYCIDKNDNDLLTSVETVPNPFVIYSLNNGMKFLKQGDELKFYITIFGKAITYLHYFIHALLQIENLGIGVDRKKVEITYIKDMKSGHMLVDGKNMFIANVRGHDLGSAVKDVRNITLIFDTPLRIKDEGQFTQNISFHLLMRNVLRRLAMIYEYHMDTPFESDYKRLLEDAQRIKTESIQLRWQKLFRYSSRLDRKLSIGGAIGRATYKGELGAFLPYIHAGQVLHIGKGCTLGLGHYNIIEA